MKKYKVHFSFFNLFRATQEEVAQLQTIIGGLTATITGTAFINENPELAMYVGVGGFFLNTFVKLFSFEKIR